MWGRRWERATWDHIPGRDRALCVCAREGRAPLQRPRASSAAGAAGLGALQAAWRYPSPTRDGIHAPPPLVLLLVLVRGL